VRFVIADFEGRPHEVTPEDFSANELVGREGLGGCAMNAIFVTTTIPYVNTPHVGFALELVQVDCIVRWQRQRRYDVFFLSEADENTIKNVAVARERGINPAELYETNASAFRALIDRLSISTNTFIRMSSDRHHLGACKFWEA
tara:strand:- start:3276 stop:3707 length:432 start_codon:yes stop_codon:yes gene_type:complete